MKRLLQERFILAFILLILGFAVFHDWLSTTKADFGDIVTTFYPRAVLLKQSITEYGSFFPLWEPYHLAGEPFLSKTHLGFFYLLGPLLFIAPNALAALHWNLVINVILSGIFMYIFVLYLTKDTKAGFISALVYMFNGLFLTTTMLYGWVGWSNSYALLPLLMLFLTKAVKENYILNSVISGIILGLMIWGEHGIIFLYSTVMIALYLALNMQFGNAISRATKLYLIAAIIVIVCFGIAAFKILPVIEEEKYTVRGGLDWKHASTRIIPLEKVASMLIEPYLFNQGASYKVGLIPFLLACFAIFRKPTNRQVIFFVTISIIALLLVTGSFLLYLFWQYYPAWKGMRYADRAVVMLVFSIAALSGIGASELFSKIRKSRLPQLTERAVFILIAILTLTSLVFIGSGIYSRTFYNAEAAITNNYVLQNVSKMPGIFRIHAFETNGIDFGTEFYTVPLKLENLFGYDTIWNKDYFDYLMASFKNPPKMWGIMNVKYVTSTQPVNISGFKFIGHYNNCKECFTDIPQWNKAWGPYLYENEEFMPRAYIVKDATLLITNEETQRNIATLIIADTNFNPANSAIILGKNNVKAYSLEELKKYNTTIIEPSTLDQEGYNLLTAYAQNGGKVIPDIFHNKFSIERQETIDLMNTYLNGYKAIPDSNVITHSFDSKEIQLDGETEGFLIISEKYSMFPGWTAKADGKETEILKANGPITAVYINKGTKKVLFEYKPKSFTIGSIITIATIIALIFYFGFLIFSGQQQSLKNRLLGLINRGKN